MASIQDIDILTHSSTTAAERAAATISALERHYYQLFYEQSPRARRSIILEQKISALNTKQRHDVQAEYGAGDYSEAEDGNHENVLHFPGLRDVRLIGRGSFGSVRLVNDNTSFYAVKIIRKRDMLRNGQEGHVWAERDFLVHNQAQLAGSEWIVTLYSAFQDSHSLYMIMEFTIGGDFLGLLLREQVLEENDATFYTAEMVLAIEAVHKHLWIHRDIKPDNFLIASSGHLKISDFGLAFNGQLSHDYHFYNAKRQRLYDLLNIDISGDAQDMQDSDISMKDVDDPPFAALQKRRAYAKTTCGTSQYMAPEIILGERYDARCDWWSLGVVLYEMLYGHTPFWTECPSQTRENIISWRHTLHFPNGPRVGRPHTDMPIFMEPPSGVAIDLVCGLITHASQRLGSEAYKCAEGRNIDIGFVRSFDADEIKAHPLFAATSWLDLHKQRPPWIPTVREGQQETQYFEDEKDMLPITQSHRRARDKILRDTAVGSVALEERLKGAFKGYEYRNPTDIFPQLD